jgi:hypothetical protein
MQNQLQFHWKIADPCRFQSVAAELTILPVNYKQPGNYGSELRQLLVLCDTIFAIGTSIVCLSKISALVC